MVSNKIFNIYFFLVKFFKKFFVVVPFTSIFTMTSKIFKLQNHTMIEFIKKRLHLLFLKCPHTNTESWICSHTFFFNLISVSILSMEKLLGMWQIACTKMLFFCSGMRLQILYLIGRLNIAQSAHTSTWAYTSINHSLKWDWKQDFMTENVVR